MSWFSSQWNRWNPSAPSAYSDVEWVEVVFGRQRYRLALPNIDEPLTLRHLRQELGAVFHVSAQRIVVVFQGMTLKDESVRLMDYGMDTGSQVQVLVKEQPPQQRADHGGAPRTAAGTRGGPVPPSGPGWPESVMQPPQSASQAAPQAAPQATRPAFPAQGAAAGANPAPSAPAQAAQPDQPELSEDERHMQLIDQVTQQCRTELLPDLQRFETSVQSLPDAKPGATQAAEKDEVETPQSIPPSKIPYAQRKLSELLLRELLKLDSIPTDKDNIRTARKTTVKEIQSYLERTDAAWNVATKQKGIVSDV